MLDKVNANHWANILSKVAIHVFGNAEENNVKRSIQNLLNLLNTVNYPVDIETIFVKHARNTRSKAFWDDILDLQVGSLIVNENPTQLKNLVRAKMVGKLTSEPTQYGETYVRINEFMEQEAENEQWRGLLDALAPIYRNVEYEQWQREQQDVHNRALSRASTPLMGTD